MRPFVVNAQQGEPMLEKYFSAPKTLRRLRSGISGPYMDAFAGDLEREGYAKTSAVRYLRAAAHLGCFVQRRGGVLADIDCSTLHAFVGHLRRCRCPHFKRAKVAFHRAKQPTLRLYARGAAELLQALGDDVGQWTAHAVRNFFLRRARQCGSPTHTHGALHC
jgi:hypothetical protein